MFVPDCSRSARRMAGAGAAWHLRGWRARCPAGARIGTGDRHSGRCLRLAQFDPEFGEQPTPAQSLAALHQVKESVGVPIAADQSVFNLFDVYEICRQRAADLVVLSFHEAGGLLAAPDITPIRGKLGRTDRPGPGFELNWDAVQRAIDRYHNDVSYQHG